MNSVTKLAQRISIKARKVRADIFKKHFVIDGDTKILDLGSENGTNLKRVLEGTSVTPKNVYIADIDERLVEEGAKLHGFKAVVIDESGTLPFDDDYFDIVYCSSVIEHVTIPKDEVWKCLSGREFKTRSLERQQEFANEIRRLGKGYFVQTPYKYFPIESHTWLPLIAFLPRPLLVYLIKFTNKFWIKKTSPDWYLLNKKEFQDLFPEATIIEEKTFGFTKSIMAIKLNDNKKMDSPIPE